MCIHIYKYAKCASFTQSGPKIRVYWWTFFILGKRHDDDVAQATSSTFEMEAEYNNNQATCFRIKHQGADLLLSDSCC